MAAAAVLTAQNVGKALGRAALKPGLCQKSHVDLWEEGRSISGRRDVIRRIGEPAMMKTPARSGLTEYPRVQVGRAR